MAQKIHGSSAAERRREVILTLRLFQESAIFTCRSRERGPVRELYEGQGGLGKLEDAMLGEDELYCTADAQDGYASVRALAHDCPEQAKETYE